MCCGKICSAASATRAEGTLCCICQWLDSNHYQWMRFPQEGQNQRCLMGLWPMNQRWIMSPCPKKAQQSHSRIKTMLTVFFYWEGVVPPGQTINKEYYYLNVICQLRCNTTKLATAIGNWWLAASSWKGAQLMHHVSCGVFWKNLKLSRRLSPSTVQIWCPVTSGFFQN